LLHIPLDILKKKKIIYIFAEQGLKLKGANEGFKRSEGKYKGGERGILTAPFSFTTLFAKSMSASFS
jgi:hypothetical protein